MNSSSVTSIADAVATAAASVSADSVAARVAESEKLFYIYLHSFIELIKTVPGGTILIRYIQVSYQGDPIRSVVELSLFLFAISYFLSKKTSPDSKASVPLTEKEIDELCKLWKPAPLLDEVTPQEAYKLKQIPQLDRVGLSVDLLANDKGPASIEMPKLTNVTNLASMDFLSLSHDKTLVDAAEDVIKNHGVGACGPPNFLGNQDLHISLETRLASWMGTEAGIIYGQDFATSESILPTFLKRGDVAIIDSGVNLSIQKGILLSRCQAYYYKHNDLNHLKAILDELQDELSDIKPLNRRYIVTEGIFANSGDYPDIVELLKIKKQYKFRLFLDESLSIGTIGPNGKGLTDLFGVPSTDVDILVGSLSNSLSSGGGFCVGVKAMIFAQRINSAAYCFSASLPPYNAKVAHETINMIENSVAQSSKKNLITALNDKSAYLFNKFEKNRKFSKYFDLMSTPNSPVLMFQLNQAVKKQLGLHKYYYNETNKFAVAHDKGMKIFEGVKEVKTQKPKLSDERVDYYSPEAISRGRREDAKAAEMKALDRNQFEVYNLESFVLAKIANELLVKDKILIVANQRLLRQETMRVYPNLRVFISREISTADLDKTAERLVFHAGEVLNGLKSRDDIEKMIV